jgi:regulation of enolase protein 1 (concanavalin A-like superfamily)
MSFAGCTWLNPPSKWSLDNACLQATTDAATDFWRETHYGFTRDSGHFFGSPVAGDFTAQLRVRAKYEALYDQAGIMIRIDDRQWVKAGLENSDGENRLSSVLTIGQSDWAPGAYNHDPFSFWIRATVSGGALRLQISSDGRRWPVFRLAPFRWLRPISSDRCVAHRSEPVWRLSSRISSSSRPWTKIYMTFPKPRPFWKP